MKRLNAFDLHEVLLKQNELAVVESTNESLRKHGRTERLSVELSKKLRGQPWGNYYRALCPEASESDISSMVEYGRSMDHIVIPKYSIRMPYAKEVLEHMKRSGDTVLVISFTVSEALKKYINCIGLSQLVDASIGITDAEEKSSTDVAKIKGERLLKYIKRRKFDAVNMVGDTDADIAAGRMAGAKTFYFNENGEICPLADHSISNLMQLIPLIYG